MRECVLVRSANGFGTKNLPHWETSKSPLFLGIYSERQLMRHTACLAMQIVLKQFTTEPRHYIDSPPSI